MQNEQTLFNSWRLPFPARGFRGLLAAALLATTPAMARDREDGLLQPRLLTVDASLPKAQLDAHIDAARRYDSFWNNGEAELARTALAPDFIDRTLPPGRPQGVEGPLAASEKFRAAVPDLSCEIEQMIVARDRVVAHLHFRGHFTGRFAGTVGQGQTIDFIATDIYRVAGARIVEDWHIEDNLTLLQQLGQTVK